MKKITLTLTALFMLLLNVNAQITEKEKAEEYLATKGELTFTFQVTNDSDIEMLTQNMSLVNYDASTKTVKAWANKAQFRNFETQNIVYQVPKSENEVDEDLIYDVRPLANRPNVLTNRSGAATLTFPVNTYPTYAEYAQQMQDFENDYPSLVEKVSIGTTGEGDKELLFVKISDNVSTDEQEPKLMLTSSMHGDEIAGYPMMLSLIDYILTVYSNTGHADHARIKNLVENSEIWINPSANPDGTYNNSSGNTSVVQAIRANANGVDLNRNYPDNIAGAHYDGEVYQTEALADANNFVISANFHGGTELVNYPFDNVYAENYIHADNDWFEHIGVEYATHCQTDANSGGSSTPSYSNKASYMTDDDDWDNPGGAHAHDFSQSPGVTHGAEWYRVFGGRQDYMNFYQQCREVTIELSDVKILAESSLVDYWYYNRDALLDFLTQGTYGFRGVVKDANTSSPIDATVTLVGHDAYGSDTVTDTSHGDFYRPVKAGSYDILIEAPCYQPVTISEETISDYQTKVLADIMLTPIASTPTGLAASNVSATTATLSWDEASGADYDLRYREVGSSTWIVSTLSDTTIQLSGLTILTQYEAQVRSNCGSFNSAYSSSVLFTTTDVVSCVGTVISTFPHLETFDSGIGDWTQDSGDSGNWTLDASGTQSNNTGPSDDITTGGNYFYTEASSSGLGSNATVILTSPCYDLSSLTQGSFSFYYHMYGTNVGTLNLEVTSDNGDNWINVFTASGNVGNLWNAQNIDLASYLGQTVKFRFTGITGNGWSSDIAIDHIAIGEPIIPDYCASNGNSTADENIGRVQLNTLDNNNSGMGTTGTGYSDFTENPSLTTILFSGTQYTITITPEWTGGSFNEGYSVWIDYNHDGDFEDGGEQIWTQAPTNNTTVSGSFTLPTAVEYGETQIRVSMKYNAIPNECESFGYGEVEDYTVNIKYDGLLFTNNIWDPSAPDGTTSSEDVLILDGTYNVNSEISINSITVNAEANVNVEKGQSVTVVGDIINNGEFVLNSDSDEYSSLLVDGIVTGDIKYGRHVNSSTNRNDLVSPPVSGQSFTDFVSNNSNILSNSGNTLYLFGPFEKPTNEYQLYSNVESSNLEVAKGYRTASTDNGTFMFSGAVTNSALVVPIVKTGSNYEKWNLIGNPYTSYIKLSDFLAANLTELDPQSAAVYGYDANDSNGSYWTIWNLAYSDAHPNTLIAPGQGFFVSSKDGGSNISFTPSMRTAGSSDDFIAGRTTTNSIIHSIIEMSNGTKTYGTEFYLTDNATLGLDLGYDAEHFGGAPTDFAIYSELTENSQALDMAIQSIGFNDVNNDLVIPLGVNAAQGEQNTISMVEPNLEYNAYLEDALTNTFTLLNTSDYIFTADTDLSDTGRFYLRFGQDALSVIDSDLDNIQVYTDSNLKQIVVKGQLNEDTLLTLYDIQGRQILKRTLDSNDNVHSINTSQYTSGIYLVKLSNNLTTMTKKLIIR